MRFLLFSLVVMFCSCRSEYKTLQTSSSTANCMDNFAREFETAWYAATIDVYGKHLSGLLLIKNMGDETFRTVFTNEAGVTFFDFEFSRDSAFRVKKVIKQLDRKPVINTLRDDFSLILLLPFKGPAPQRLERDDEIFLASRRKNETAYFITDRDCASLRRLEWASKRKPKVTISLTGEYSQPLTAAITHHNFDMVINLKKIEKE